LTQPRSPEDAERAPQPAAPRRRRVKRGIVASYIHDISRRHRDGQAPLAPEPVPAVAAPQPTTGA
jgi:hypothetical protein